MEKAGLTSIGPSFYRKKKEMGGGGGPRRKPPRPGHFSHELDCHDEPVSAIFFIEISPESHTIPVLMPGEKYDAPCRASQILRRRARQPAWGVDAHSTSSRTATHPAGCCGLAGSRQDGGSIRRVGVATTLDRLRRAEEVQRR